jgi:hypothetical protein
MILASPPPQSLLPTHTPPQRTHAAAGEPLLQAGAGGPRRAALTLVGLRGAGRAAAATRGGGAAGLPKSQSQSHAARPRHRGEPCGERPGGQSAQGRPGPPTRAR